jgi:hypothetical protein
MTRHKAGEVYLLIDVGHVLTHAAYVTRVEGTARLVSLAKASTTGLVGGGGLLEGVRRAAANLELLVGRHLLDAVGELRRPSSSDGQGVDGAVVTTSLVPPLRVALVGLTRDLSLASAVRAATVPYVNLVRTICLETSVRRWEAEDLEALIETPLDAVVLVGGVDGGPATAIHDMGEMLSVTYSALPASMRPVVIFGGNERVQRSLVAAFSGVTELRLVANVRPSVQMENLGELRAALAWLFHRRGIGGSPELQKLGQWAGTDIVHDLDAFARMLRFLAKRYELARGVLGVDLGGNGSRVLLVRPEGAALTWVTPYGMGAGLAALRELNDPTAVVRWMCQPLSWAEVWDRLSNLEVRPAGVPQTIEDWDLQQATAREVLSRTWAGAQAAWSSQPGDGQGAGDLDMVVARGTVLTHARTPGQAALALIDGLELAGLLRLSLDWANLLPGLASLSQANALAAVQVLDNDGLMELGTLVAPTGRVGWGADALRLRVVVHGETRTEMTVPGGSIWRLPLGVNERARLELYPARGLDLGVGHRGRGVMAEVRGGALGVIVDARGRPLSVPREESERCRILAGWQREIDGEGGRQAVP